MSQILNKITNKTTVVDQLILIASVHRKKRFNPITIVKKTINSSICGPNFFQYMLHLIVSQSLW